MAKLDPDDVKAIVDAVVTRLPEAVWAFRSASNGDQVDMRQYLVNAQPIGVWGYRNPADAVDMHQMLVDVHDAAQ